MIGEVVVASSSYCCWFAIIDHALLMRFDDMAVGWLLRLLTSFLLRKNKK
jgi:hypothetical protein